MRLRTIFAVLGSLLLSAGAATAESIERELTFDPGQVRLSRVDGVTRVEARGAMRETTPGHPDVVWYARPVELPAGKRVSRVELLALEGEAIADGVRLPSSLRIEAGLTPEARTEPLAERFAGEAAQPIEPVRLGLQGNQRGRELAHILVSAVRWTPGTGRLEATRRVRVRLELVAHDEPVARRERIVPEWEDGPISPAQARGAVLTHVSGPKREAEPFRAQQLPSVLGSPVAYVIVTNDAMAPVFQQLAEWKTQTGVPAVVRTMSFVRAQYPGGADDAERLRDFLRDAYTRWGTKWVLLGGDTDVIPDRSARTIFYGGENIVTDLYFSALDGNWNADGDSLFGEGYQNVSFPGDAADLFPEVYVGRAAVSTPAEAQVFVNKTLQYIRTPPAAYGEEVLLFSEVLFPQDWNGIDFPSLDGAELSEDILPILDQMPNYRVTRLYENHLDPRWRPGALLETYQAVLDSLNDGPHIAVHTGHGYRNIMSVGDGSLVNADAAGLTNGDRLINLYAINCTSTAIDFPCIGEAFMKNPSGGAVTNIGSTRFDFPTAGRVYKEEFFRLFIEDSITAIGELQARQKIPFIGFSTYDGVNRWTQMTMLLLGDPELRMWLGTPRTMDVGLPTSVVVSDSQFTVTVSDAGQPLAGARVVGYRAGDEYSIVTTNALGQAVIPFRPDSLGQVTVTVTAINRRPVQVQIPIVATAGVSLADAGRILDDDAVGGTVGNGDQTVDAGETVDLRVAVLNRGAALAPAVEGVLTTTDPSVTIVQSQVAYGAVAGGGSSNPAGGFRIQFPYNLTDQREVPFTLTLFDGNGRRWVETFQIVVRAPELAHYGHTYAESGGLANGRPDAGETLTYGLRLRNRGTGEARLVAVRARSYDGLITVTDSVSSLGTVASGTEVTGDPIVFTISSLSAKLSLVFFDEYGELATKQIDFLPPTQPTTVVGVGAATSISLTWARITSADLLGYNVYRSTASAGPYTKVTTIPTGRTAYYRDAGLAPLTRYFYRVSAVDSSGNESAQSVSASASTNPPLHAIFPIPTGRTTPASAAIEFMYGADQMDIVTGSDKVYLLRADGSAPVDADGSSVTAGDFSEFGSYFAAGPSVATLAPGQGWSVVAGSWDSDLSSQMFVFDSQGEVRPGWPLTIPSGLWSAPSIADLDGDGDMEIAFGSNGSQFYVMRHDGTEWIDGDANPATTGVFANVGSAFHYGSPALADLDGDNLPEIVFGTFAGQLFAWKANGTVMPGFPFNTSGNITGSAAIGYLDGPGDTSPEIVFASSNDSLYILNTLGQRRSGWPKWTKTTGATKTPSPALADINLDGRLDIVWQSSNGGVYVWDTGSPGGVIPPFSNIRYSVLTNGASESSPVVADINGDGRHDIIVGDEFGLLTAISGLNGQILPGFPIQLEAEVKGAPAVGDIDRDGMSEIIVTGWDKNLYVWDYDFPFSPGGPAPWPQFHHDARRTGFFNAPLFVGVEDGPEAGAVTRLELSALTPNPSRAGTRIDYAVPADAIGRPLEVAVYDLSGRQVRMVTRGPAQSGRFSARWDLRSDDGVQVRGGVYFARVSVDGVSRTRKLVVLE